MKYSSENIRLILSKIQGYSLVIFIALIAIVYGYIITTSGRIALQEPSDHQVNENYKGTKSPKIDDVIVNKLNELENRSIKFNAIINEARNNPFE